MAGAWVDGQVGSGGNSGTVVPWAPPRPREAQEPEPEDPGQEEPTFCPCLGHRGFSLPRPYGDWAPHSCAAAGTPITVYSPAVSTASGPQPPHGSAYQPTLCLCFSFFFLSPKPTPLLITSKFQFLLFESFHATVLAHGWFR